MNKLLPFLIFMIPTLVFAQPSTEVYLFDLQSDSGRLSISNPVNVSNNEGYDNQPSFWPDSKSVLYARNIDGQTEIARYTIATGETKVISQTPQGGEYSPTAMPDGRISSIRLDTTGLQRLYAYNLMGKNEVLVPELVIGYHTWISESEIVCFVLGDPATLQVVNVATGEANIIRENIGRSLHKVPNQTYFSYLDKSKEPWDIKAYDHNSKTTLFLARALEGSEDYCWTQSGIAIMGQGTKLFHWYKGRWREFADVGNQDLGNVSRLAVSGDDSKLAVVVSN